MALTVRLDPRTERALTAAARRRGLSRSDVVREAVVQYGAADAEQGPDRPYAAWLDVLGVVDLGVREAGLTTGEQFTRMLHSRARARRPR
jgi:hypothetical protein